MQSSLAPLRCACNDKAASLAAAGYGDILTEELIHDLPGNRPMKRWALVTTLLYVLVLVALALPLICVAFSKNDIKTVEDVADAATLLYFEAFSSTSRSFGFFLLIVFWIPLGVLGLAQYLLLQVPVRLEVGKPVSRALWILERFQ